MPEASKKKLAPNVAVGDKNVIVGSAQTDGKGGNDPNAGPRK